MPKRKHKESKEDKWRRKLKKYEAKLRSNYDDDLESDGSATLLYSSRSPSPARMASAVTSMVAAHTPVYVPELAAPPLLLPPTAPGPEQPASDGTPPAGASTDSAQTSSAVDDGNPILLTADPELLKALGDFESETTEWGPDIVAELGMRWDPILKDGLKKEIKDGLLKQHLLPKNCPLLKSPVLNPEIAAMLNESAKNRDTRVLRKQSQLGCVLAILGKTMSGILAKTSDMSDILRLLTDATKLLSDSHYMETETRRSLVTPMVDKTFIEPFKDRKRDSHLFGEKLGEFIKNSRGIQKTGQLIQSSAPVPHLNYKGPPLSRQQHRNARTYPRRGGASGAYGGGQRTAAPTYRRQRGSMHASTSRARRALSPPSQSAAQHSKSAGAPVTGSNAKQ